MFDNGPREHEFKTGYVHISEVVKTHLRDTAEKIEDFLVRYRSGDWGDVNEDQVAINAGFVKGDPESKLIYARYCLKDDLSIAIITFNDDHCKLGRKTIVEWEPLLFFEDKWLQRK